VQSIARKSENDPEFQAEAGATLLKTRAGRPRAAIELQHVRV
jgi:hypothetical protein